MHIPGVFYSKNTVPLIYHITIFNVISDEFNVFFVSFEIERRTNPTHRELWEGESTLQPAATCA